MTTSSQSPWMTTAGVTRNGEIGGGFVSSFEMLNLPGMVVSFANDDSQTFSQGSDAPASGCYIGSRSVVAEVSQGSVDSSMLCAGLAGWQAARGSATVRVEPELNESAFLSVTAMLLALGGVVELLIEAMDNVDANKPSSVE